MGPEVETRVTFRYDEHNRVLEQSSYFGDRMRERIVRSYNEVGDLAFQASGEEVYHIEYEYDQWRNWTRQVVRHPAESVECRRVITYYE